MSKTYFNYQSTIKSKDLGEAISLPIGYGPLCGFGGHSLDATGSSITITPEPGNGLNVAADKNFYDRFHLGITDRIRRRSLFKTDDGVAGNFTLITKDGYLWTSNQNQLSITIEGSRGINEDILVFAIHTPIEENVDNPVEFRAFWSQSSVGFYDLYKRSLDPDYPTALASRSIEGFPYNISDFSYDNLLNLTAKSLPEGVYNENSMTLVGIYGTGNDAMSNGTIENYRIIPYESKFPMVQEYNTGEAGLIYNTLKRLNTLTEGVPVEYKSIIEYLTKKIPSAKEETTSIVSSGLPKGTIIMWYGDTLPYGWELCDGEKSTNDPTIVKPNLMGRVPIGYSNNNAKYKTLGRTGGKEEVTLKEDQMPRHHHVFVGDNNAVGNFSDVESGFPAKVDGVSVNANEHNVRGAAGNGAAFAYYTSYQGGDVNGKTSPIETLPPYTVVKFIIKTIND